MKITDKMRLDFISRRTLTAIPQDPAFTSKNRRMFIDFMERGDGVFNMNGEYHSSLRSAIDAAIRTEARNPARSKDSPEGAKAKGGRP